MIGRYRTTLLLLGSAALFAGCSSSPVVPHTQVSRTVPVEAPASRSLSVRERAAAIAIQQVGTPYRYGGASPKGFDCSGLVHYAYGQAGRPVPRTTGGLWSEADLVPRESLREGDLLFFRFDGKMSHVGMYVGHGRFVHAPSSGKRVTVQSLGDDIYRQAFVRAGRL